MPDDHSSITKHEMTEQGSRRTQAICETVVAVIFFGVIGYASLGKLFWPAKPLPGQWWDHDQAGSLSTGSAALAVLLAGVSGLVLTGLVFALPLRLLAISRDEAREKKRLQLEALERRARAEELTATLQSEWSGPVRDADPVACEYCGVIRAPAEASCAGCGSRRSTR